MSYQIPMPIWQPCEELQSNDDLVEKNDIG
jgi:hypothetical protein